MVLTVAAGIDVKNDFLRFLYFGHVFTFLTFFYFSNFFFIFKKTLAKSRAFAGI